jgi:hypothetical protein
LTGDYSIDVVLSLGGKDGEMVAVDAEGGQRWPLEHEDVMYPLPGDIRAGIGVFPGKKYLPSAILTGD